MAQCAMPQPVAAALPEAFEAGVSWVRMPRGRCRFHGRYGPLQALLNAIAAERLQPMGACARGDGIAPWLRLSRVFAPDGDFCGSTRPLIRSRRGLFRRRI